MSGYPLNYPTDAAKFRQQYLANLNLQANINDMNLQANKIYKKTGQTPVQVTDTRTTAEKLADVERLKIDVRTQLSQIADGANAQEIVENLDPITLEFVAQHIDELVKIMKPKYKYGVPSNVFIPFIDDYMRKANITNEVDFGLQQATGANLLMSIQQMQNIVNPQTLNNLREVISQDNIQINARLRQEILQEIQQLEMLIPSRLELQQISQLQNAQTKAIITQAFDYAFQVLPTNDQIIPLLNELNGAIRRRDGPSTERISEQLQSLLAVQQSTVNQVEEVKDLLSSNIFTTMGETMGIIEPKKTGSIETTESLSKQQLIEEIRTLKRELPSSFTYASYGLTTNLSLSSKDQLVTGLERIKSTVINRRKAKEAREAKSGEPVLPEFGSRFTSRSSETTPSEVYGPSVRISKLSEGKGKGLIKGGSINSNIEQSNGLMSSNQYVPFGTNYIIDHHKLNRNIFSLKRSNKNTVYGFPVRRISDNLGIVLRTIIGKGNPKYDDINKLTNEEKDYLYKVSKRTKLIDKIGIQSPSKSEDEKDINQFEIYKGEILNGNDSNELVKKFKILLMKLLHKELLPKGEVKEILLELSQLGY